MALWAVEAAHYTALHVEHSRPEEPMSGRDDHVIEVLDFGGPFLVELVEVEVERTGIVALCGLYQIRRPEDFDGEVVVWVFVAFELRYVFHIRDIHSFFYLEMQEKCKN